MPDQERNPVIDLRGFGHAVERFDQRYAKKGEGGQAGIATSETPGIIKPGPDFDVEADGTLKRYEAIAVNSLTVSPSAAERGSTVADVVAKWGTNKTPESLTLNGEAVVAATSQKTLSGVNLTADTTYTLVAKDARDAEASRSATVYFRDKRHWWVGAQDADGVTDDVVNAAAGELATSRAKTFALTAGEGQHIFYAFPHSWGMPRFFVGGFEGGFSLLKTYDHVNASGATVSYDVYKSTNANLGATTVEVK